MVEIRWERDMEEAMELIYRIQTDHGGKLAESEARENLGAWVADAAERAERLSWLVAKGSPAVLTVTYGGRKALDAAIASKNTVPPPYWLSGSIPHVQSPTGPVLPPGSYKPYEALKKKTLEEGILTQEDIDRIAGSPRREDQPGEPEEYRGLYEASFPGRRWFMVDIRYADDHPFGGGALAGGRYKYMDKVRVKRGEDLVLNGQVGQYLGGGLYLVFVSGQGPQRVGETDLSPRTDEE